MRLTHQITPHRMNIHVLRAIQIQPTIRLSCTAIFLVSSFAMAIFPIPDLHCLSFPLINSHECARHQCNMCISYSHHISRMWACYLCLSTLWFVSRLLFFLLLFTLRPAFFVCLLLHIATVYVCRAFVCGYRKQPQQDDLSIVTKYQLHGLLLFKRSLVVTNWTEWREIKKNTNDVCCNE